MKLCDNLYLASKATPAELTSVEPAPVNHILCIDCSGSMSGELPQIREQLKAKLPKLLGEHDTVSIVWFSGRGQFGTLLTAEPVATLADLQTVNGLIDRWLRPIGMTGFKEPLEEVSRLVEKIGRVSLFFMSDGCENQWGRDAVLKAIEHAAVKIAQATFVEYGYYADRPLLTAMAEKAGGTLIFAEDFDRYDPTFEAAMHKVGVERVELEIPGDVIGGFAFSLSDGDLYAFGVTDGKISVPKGSTVYWLAPTGKELTDPELLTIASCMSAPIYAALSLFSLRMNSNVVWALLKYLGDVAFIDQFASCFGKQKYSSFQEAAKRAAFDPSLRLTQGKDCNRVPRDDAFTVLQLLEELAKDGRNHLLLEHPEFKYSKISRKRIDPVLARKKELPELIAKETDEAHKIELQKELDDLENYKPLKFEVQESSEGYSVSNLTYNEERPNISVLVRKTGTVDLTVPEGSKIPEKFETFIFRNYAIVKDGLVNVERLPVRLTQETWDVLAKEGLVSADYKPEVVLDISKLPILNRKMVDEVSAKRLFELEYALTKARAAQKVYGHFKKEHFPRKSMSFEILYGKESAAWLKEIGITDYSGFGPKGIAESTTDVYLGKELKISLKGFSSLPTVKDVKDRMAKNKLTPSAAIMVPIVKKVDDFLASDIYNKAADKDKLFEAWLDGQTKEATRQVRELIAAMARVKFAIVIAQVWPKEFASLDENSLTIEVDGQKIEAKLDMKEVEIKI